MKWILLLLCVPCYFNVILGSDKDVTACAYFRNDKNKWYSYQNGTTCYQINWYEKRSFYEAEKFCTDQGGHLLSLHSENETSIVLQIIKEAYPYPDSKLWIGIRKDEDSGLKEKWTDNTVVDYVNWADDKDQEEPLEHCAYLKDLGYRFSGKTRWYHANCNENLWSICKKDASDKPVTPKPESNNEGHCEEGWIRYENKCFLFINENKDFDSTVVDCRSKYNSEPVSIHSESDQGFITALAGSINESAIWLGGYRGFTWTFTWKSNEPFKYTNWLPSQPSLDKENKCLRMVIKSTFGYGRWDNVKCDLRMPYICQKSIKKFNPTPSTAIFPQPCPDQSGYVKFRKSCFKLHTSQNSWSEAEGICKSEGGTLSSVADGVENYLLKYLTNRENISNAWIGMKGFKHEHQVFHWEDDTHLYFTNWGQIDTNPNSTQCVYLESSGLWNATTNCDQRMEFVCRIHEESPRKKDRKKAKCPTVNGTQVDVWHDLDPELNNCYMLGTSEIGFGAAEFNCGLNDGKLVSIHSEHEAKLLAEFSKRFQTGRYTTSVWIGLHRKTDGGWKWTDDSSVDYLDWDDGQPKNSTEDNCVVAWPHMGGWGVRTCQWYFKSPYICSAPKIPVPEPESTNLESKGSRSTFVTVLLVVFILALICVAAIAAYYGYNHVQRNRQVGNRKSSNAAVAFVNVDEA